MACAMARGMPWASAAPWIYGSPQGAPVRDGHQQRRRPIDLAYVPAFRIKADVVPGKENVFHWALSDR